MNRFRDPNEIAKVVEGFESCTTGKADFKHADHLTVAVYYLQNLSVSEATERLRTSLLRFIDHHGVDRKKYNETITVFWLELTASELENLSERSFVEQCNAVLESLNDPSLALKYYSSDLLFSAKARASFVEPDLKSWRR